MSSDNNYQVLVNKIDNLARITAIGVKDVLDFKEALIYTGYSAGHMYKLTSQNAVPYFKKNAKIYFLKDELRDWLCSNRQKTTEEVEQEATTYILRHQRK